jgi:hypothetical protein
MKEGQVASAGDKAADTVYALSRGEAVAPQAPGLTANPERYRHFIAGSYVDFGVAKHAYVASRCGWFSDRATCFLAAAKPVLHQDTGFCDWLPVGEGVLLFSEPEDVIDALSELEGDYSRHAQAARVIAEEYFEASRVLRPMLEQAGFC